MHFCTVNIMIGGDVRNIVVRDHFAPVSWPEIEVLRVLHGEESITDVETFVGVPQSAKAERERLALLYGEEPCTYLWGGKNPPREMAAPRATLNPDIIWFNPLTNRAENTGRDGKSSVPVPPRAAQPFVPDGEQQQLSFGDPRPGRPGDDGDPDDEDDDGGFEPAPPVDEPEPFNDATPRRKR